MATKERKTLVRIAPELARALNIIAACRGVPSYAIAEEAVSRYVLTDHPCVPTELIELIKEKFSHD